MEEVNRVQTEKRARFESRAQAVQEEVARRNSELDEASLSVSCWKHILTYITSIGTHGSSKPSDMPWNQFFQQAFPHENLTFDMLQLPSCFEQHDMAFSDCLFAVTAEISNAEKTKDKFSSRLKKATSRCQEIEGRAQKRSERDKRLLDKVNRFDELHEAVKTLGLWVGSMLGELREGWLYMLMIPYPPVN